MPPPNQCCKLYTTEKLLCVNMYVERNDKFTRGLQCTIEQFQRLV
jgi:hypothetical protein